MKTKERPGEFYFKALVRQNNTDPLNIGFALTYRFYESRESVQADYPDHDIQWPIEEIGDSILYVPTQEELEENL